MKITFMQQDFHIIASQINQYTRAVRHEVDNVCSIFLLLLFIEASYRQIKTEIP